MQEFLEILKKEKFTFENPDEFFIKKNFIKEKYKKLDIEVKILYKMYFFTQLCMLKNKYKTVFWDFLNDRATFEMVNKTYFDFCNYRDSLFRKKGS